MPARGFFRRTAAFLGAFANRLLGQRKSRRGINSTDPSPPDHCRDDELYHECARLMLDQEREALIGASAVLKSIDREITERCHDLNKNRLDVAIQNEIERGYGTKLTRRSPPTLPSMEAEVVQSMAQLSREVFKCGPLAEINNLIVKSKVSWSSNVRSEIKAYVLSCFSELAYIHLIEHEIAERNRYQLFAPSVANRAFREIGLRIDVSAATRTLDAEIIIERTAKFVYLIVRFREIWIVAVRGTASFRDLVIDLRAHKSQESEGVFHSGFYDEAQCGLKVVRKHIPKGSWICFTGHSMGAAVAAIMSRVWPERKRVLTPYLFAPPRFADASTASLVPRFSYVRSLDFAPHVPLKLMGYSDACAEIQVVPGGVRQWGPLISGLVTIDQLFATHSIERYRLELGQAIGSDYPETVYIDQFVAALKQERKKSQYWNPFR